MKAKATRRQFLGVTGVVGGVLSGVPMLIPASALGLTAEPAPSERITLGVIGIGPRATYDLQAMLKLPDVRCLAIADVQASRREAGKKLVDEFYGNQDCVTYRDFRELLDRKDIDTVLVATGDRWHAPASIMAAEAGKDVYSEKPCGITIAKCQELAKTFSRTKRIFQAGTQRRSVPNFIYAVELARSGKLGKIHTLYASVYEPQLDNSWLPREQTPPRDVVDWNLWLGPAPWRPYNQKYVQGGWRGYFDFDSGARLLDWGAHTVDLCQWAIGADNTVPVEYEPMGDKIVCTYASGVKLILEFLKTPFGDRSPKFITELGTCPVRFVGEEGWVETGDNGGIEVHPDTLKKEVPEAITRVRGLDVSAHARNFFDCVKSRAKTVTNEDVMRHSHVACHAAAIAWILDRKLRFDPKTEKFIGDEEANLLCARPERNPFTEHGV
ncbi:MAG TPA: Gfo/Idh/MocA family oxidoreductase [Thermogutta sp.]|nr:Gfo/Idh/MocA family oxidoreductase [Thermogutta sp.]HPU06804.1 Gfo/Idh/MocA family oxidoreductase [Thermogutta sp.]